VTEVDRLRAANESFGPQVLEGGGLLWEKTSGSQTELKFFDGGVVEELDEASFSQSFQTLLPDDGSAVWEKVEPARTRLRFFAQGDVQTLDDRSPSCPALEPSCPFADVQHDEGDVLWRSLQGSRRELRFAPEPASLALRGVALACLIGLAGLQQQCSRSSRSTR